MTIARRVNLRNLKQVMEAKVKVNRYAGFEVALKLAAKEMHWGEVQSEFRFHPIRRWRSDFAIPEAKLLIEIEGGFWIAGRHNRGGGGIADMCKYNTAAIIGYSVLRFTPQQANKLEAVGVIGEWFAERGRAG